jgi:flagellin
MSSINTNATALSALQSLNMTQAALATTQNQVSTGLKVASAADNAAYWSIATQLKADSAVIGAANDSLAQNQSMMNTANTAINSIVTTINSIETALTQATNPGADIANIQTALTSLGQQLTDAVSAASFNGLNFLDGSQTATLNFVSGFTASATGGTINTIAFTAQALTGSGALLTQGSTDLTNITVTDAASASTALTDTQTALAAVTNYAALIGSTQNRMTSQSTINGALTTDYATGVSALVDANMNEASTRLQALQTQQQLGIQSLSIANQSSQLILKLFQ